MSPDRIRRWFELTREEQLWVAAILAIFLLGLVARWHHATRGAADEPAGHPPSAMENE